MSSQITQVKCSMCHESLDTYSKILGNKEAHQTYLSALDEGEIKTYLAANGIDCGEAATRYGAAGYGPSLYITDPDGNVVDLLGMIANGIVINSHFRPATVSIGKVVVKQNVDRACGLRRRGWNWCRGTPGSDQEDL